MSAEKSSWTEGSFGDEAKLTMSYQVEGQEPDRIALLPLRSIPAVTLYTEQGSWVRMNPKDLHDVGTVLLEAAAAYGYVPEDEEVQR